MKLTIRPATPRDLAAVDALLAASYPRQLKADYPPSVLVTAVPHIARAQPALLACGTYYLAEAEDGAILGAGGITRDRADAALGHVRHVVTDWRHARKGIGRAVMTHAIARARDDGIEALVCWSTRTAVPFYASLGFQAQGPIDVPLAPGVDFPAIAMTCKL